METLKIIGAIIGLTAYLPLWIGIAKNKVEQNFATYLLWSSLDLISVITIILLHGNFWLPVGYTIGAGTTAAMLAFKRQVHWTKLDTLITVLVVVSLIAWYVIGARAGTVASVTALCIASIPQIIHTARKPESTPTLTYLIFTVANLCSLIGAKNWSIEESLFSGTAVVLCFLMVLLSLRKPK